MPGHSLKRICLALRRQRPRPHGDRRGRLPQPQRRRARHPRRNRRRRSRRNRDRARALVPGHVRERLRVALLRHWGARRALRLLNWLAGAQRCRLRHARHDGRLVVRRRHWARLERGLAVRIEPARAPTVERGRVRHARRRVALVVDSRAADRLEQ